MAVRTDIQYVPYYFEESTARKLEKKPQQKHAATPKHRKAKRKVVVIDPVAIIGTVVAACMLVMMLVGFVEYRIAQNQTKQMSEYIQQLQQENAQLQQTYEDGYDLDHIREVAGALGMIPAADAPQVEIQVEVPQDAVTEQTGLWESFTTFLAGLFA